MGGAEGAMPPLSLPDELRRKLDPAGAAKKTRAQTAAAPREAAPARASATTHDSIASKQPQPPELNHAVSELAPAAAGAVTPVESMAVAPGEGTGVILGGGTASAPSEDTAAGPSHYWTWRLLAAGFTPDECASIRGFSPEVVLDHALRAADAGLEVDAAWFLSAAAIARIEQALGSTQSSRIRPLLARLPRGTRYEEVQLVLKTHRAKSSPSS
jgi:hypothetical protein